MIGIILSGHGNFGEGLYSTIKLLAGEQENFIPINFDEGKISLDLANELNKAIDLVDQNKGVVIFTDIVGGTPFNEAVKLSLSKENLKVVAGTNIPQLMDAIFKRELSTEEFIKTTIDTGKNAMIQFEVKRKSEEIKDKVYI